MRLPIYATGFFRPPDKALTIGASWRQLAKVRNDDATTIVAGVLKAIADKTEYKSLYSIYILYADRAVGSSKNKVIDTIEFRKNQKGEFEIHLT
jgi:hypothetical protein